MTLRMTAGMLVLALIDGRINVDGSGAEICGWALHPSLYAAAKLLPLAAYYPRSEVQAVASAKTMTRDISSKAYTLWGY